MYYTLQHVGGVFMNNNDKVLDLVIKAKEDIASLGQRVETNSQNINKINHSLNEINDNLDDIIMDLKKDKAIDSTKKETANNNKALVWEIISSILFPILVTLIAKLLNL